MTCFLQELAARNGQGGYFIHCNKWPDFNYYLEQISARYCKKGWFNLPIFAGSRHEEGKDSLYAGTTAFISIIFSGRDCRPHLTQ
jgi:hypothetical protein